MAYFDRQEAESFLGKQTLLNLYDDEGDGTFNEDAFNFNANLAAARVDGKLKRSYAGDVPNVQSPVPQNIKMCALLYFKAFTYQRRPEYVREYGGSPLKEADKFAEEIVTAETKIPDNAAEPEPRNVGGSAFSAGPRLITTADDGSSNGGDF